MMARILQIVSELEPDAYGNSISEQYLKKFSKDISLGEIHANLRELHNQDFVSSQKRWDNPNRKGVTCYWYITDKGRKNRGKMMPINNSSLPSGIVPQLA